MTDAAPIAIEHLLAQLPADAVGQYLTHGYLITQVVYACAKLGVCDMVRDGEKPIEELAAASGTEPDPLYRLMRCAATLGLVEERDDRRFAPTTLSRSLATGGPLWLRTMVHCEVHYQAMAGLVDAIRTNKPQYRERVGLDIWQHLQSDPELGTLFSRSMSERDGLVEAIMEFDLFASTRSLVDVGGALGHVARSVVTKYPAVSAVIFDRPDVVEQVTQLLPTWGFDGRLRAVSGSFFDEVPAADMYVLSRILHDWDNDTSQRILERCRAAATTDARIILVEMIMPAPNHGARAKLLDLCMLVCFGGRERSIQEFRTLLACSGWELDQTYKTKQPWHVLVAHAI